MDSAQRQCVESSLPNSCQRGYARPSLCALGFSPIRFETGKDSRAFPGAEGGGMYSLGGRGGKVLVVNNLNDDGPGSFRWACEQGGARIIVFNVSGVIRLKTPIIVRAPYVTIAGQTAPGDGVCVTGESLPGEHPRRGGAPHAFPPRQYACMVSRGLVWRQSCRQYHD